MTEACRQSAGNFVNHSREIAIGILATMLVSCSSGPYILSGYGSMQAAARARDGAHPAIDYGGSVGDAVLAAADGNILSTGAYGACGNGIWISHERFKRYTLYCHLSEIRVTAGDTVRRGQVIGLLGATGEPTWRTPPGGTPLPQLHVQLSDSPWGRSDGDLSGTYDPLSISVGCFDSTKTYPNDRLVLTHPVVCLDDARK
jgi:murein DD-endopeptidase MepM/ murein hydrolase activator NlpD